MLCTHWKMKYSDAETNNIFRSRFEAENGYDPLDPPDYDYSESCAICGEEAESGIYCEECRKTVIDELRWLKAELKTDWETLWDAIDSTWEEAVEGDAK